LYVLGKATTPSNVYAPTIYFVSTLFTSSTSKNKIDRACGIAATIIGIVVFRKPLRLKNAIKNKYVTAQQIGESRRTDNRLILLAFFKFIAFYKLPLYLNQIRIISKFITIEG
jgi:hypothetical protein